MSSEAWGPEGNPTTAQQIPKTWLIRSCQSPCNTPILPVQMPTRQYQLVQDSAVWMRRSSLFTHWCQTHTPSSANCKGTHSVSAWDLKDAFFWIPQHPDSQYLFAFEWRDPYTLGANQYTWTVLPQDLQDGLHLFGNALARERRELSLEERALQQSVDHTDKQWFRSKYQ